MTMKGIRHFALALGLAALLPLTAQADRINFYNGQKLDAKVTYVSGDLIQYRTNVGKHGSTKRIHLTNRQDVLETHAGQKYIGELIFFDSMWAEMKTPVGLQRIHRFWVDNIVLGAPRLETDTDFIETSSQLLGDSKNIPLAPGLGGYGAGDCPPCDTPGSPSLPSESRNFGKPTVEIPPEADLN